MNGAVQMWRSFYNPTSDAVWLAAAAPHGAQTVLDVGVGTGAVALCWMARHIDARVTGVDISTDMLDVAARNATLNGRDLELIATDIFSWRTARTFDLVMTNPPYFQGTAARHNAHHNVDLGAWTRAAAARVRPGGTLCTIVDAGALHRVLDGLGGHFGGIQIFPLRGGGKQACAERVIIRAKNGSAAPDALYPALDMGDTRILRDGLTLDDILATLGADD